MQIKRFKAQDMGAALAMIKKEFGPEAVILSARDVRQRSRVLGMPKVCAVEVTAAIDAEAKTGRGGKMAGGSTSPAGRIDAVQDRVSLKPKKKRMHALRTGMNVFRKKGETMAGKGTGTKTTTGTLDLHGHLVAQGIPADVAARLADRARSAVPGNTGGDASDWRGGLIRALDLSGVKTDGDTRVPGRRCIALVGPAGTGKTSVLAKLAATAPGRVGVVTLDQQRIGAMAQLQVYAKIMGWPLEMAADGKELGEALDRFDNQDLVLIDTPGLSPGSAYQIHAVKGMLAVVPNVETHLVVSATTKADDLERVHRCFLPLGIDRLVFTRLDESCSFGNLVHLAMVSGIPVAYLTDGVRVPEDIEPASVGRLADLILTPGGGRLPKTPEGPASRPGTPTPVAPAPEATPFVANRNSDIFHRPDCKWTRMIKKGNRVVFQSVEEARERKFSPCRYCSPITVEAFRPMAHHTPKRRVGARG
jgi:flagellar biosynthesis protein FlhF